MDTLPAGNGKRRSLAMALSYRVGSTALLWVITYELTGQYQDSWLITAVFAILATGLFYFNDRAWERTDWGRARPPIAGTHLATHLHRSVPDGDAE